MAANKTDIIPDDTLLAALREHVEALGLPLYTISAAAHQGTRELVNAVAARLAELPPVVVYELCQTPAKGGYEPAAGDYRGGQRIRH